MLVNRKQDWEYQAHHIDQSIKIAINKPVKLNTVLRGRCLVLLVLLTTMAMFMTMRSEAIVRAGYELVQIKSQMIKIEKENEQLRLELAKLKSPQRIQSIASNQLGMIVPPSVYCAAKTESTSQTFSKGPEQGLVNQVANAFRPAKAEAHKSN